MALTKVTGQVIKNTTDVTVGVLTVTNTLAVGGTVSIGGTLTYEDVTNIDSVGLITARNGIVVGSGITLSKDGDVFFTGIATGNGSGLTALNASNISSGTVPTARLGSGTASSSTFLRGDSTFQTVNTDLVSDTSPQLGGDLDTNGNNINFGDSGSSSDDRLVLGSDSDLEIYHTGSGAYIQNKTGSLFIGCNFDDDDGGDIRIQPKYGENSIVAYDDGPVELYYDNSRVFETDSASVKIRDSIKAKFGTDDDLEIYYDGTDGYINQKNNALKFNYNGTTKFFFGASYLSFQDDYKIGLGNSQDLRIYYNGSDSLIQHHDATSGNDLRIETDTKTIFGSVGGAEKHAVFNDDGAVELYHNNTLRLTTDSTGARVMVAGNSGLRIDGATADVDPRIVFRRHANDGSNAEPAAIQMTYAAGTTYESGHLDFFTNGSSSSAGLANRMRIRNDGLIMMRQTSTGTPDTSDSVSGFAIDSKFRGSRQDDPVMSLNRHNGTGTILGFNYNGTERGKVQTDGSIIAYQTSSDYRLKENEVLITDGIEKIKQLKPYRFNFKETPDKTVQGFFAHEVETIVPSAVSGTKDAVHLKDNETEGIKAGDIDPQQMDYAKLTPLLTAALKEAITEIESLKTRLDALEG